MATVINPHEDLQQRMSLEHFNPEFGYTAKLLEDNHGSEAQKALALEQTIWDENKFGSLEDYQKYLDQSRIFVAMDGDRCIGVTRVFEGHPHLPPFLDLPISESSIEAKLENGCRNGSIEELGTAAVPKSESHKKIAIELWRLAYRDAQARKVVGWGIIMEPPRVDVMNKRYNFTFEQLGPTVDYQGGNCAAHYLDLETVDAHMRLSNPGLYEWFVTEPL